MALKDGVTVFSFILLQLIMVSPKPGPWNLVEILPGLPPDLLDSPIESQNDPPESNVFTQKLFNLLKSFLIKCS